MIRNAVTLTLLVASLTACAGQEAPRRASRLRAAARASFVQQEARGDLRDVLLALRKVHFALESATLPPPARAALDHAAEGLVAHSEVALFIDGHADLRGASEYNLALGQRRAQAVATYLIASGVTADRLTVVSFGEERPLLLGFDAASHARNRRVEFRLMRGRVQLILDEGDLINDRGAALTASR
ncbi:MAG: OmpA family protein [Deltaproteobacteria bacterium]|nr:OmpA family protein [Deltaproteobacteria bacterium]